MTPTEPVLPDYRGACISNIIPALSFDSRLGDGWIPDAALGARQVVLFAVDGLGWAQLQARAALAPIMTSLVGGPITTVAPSTTSTALTSLTTGLPPGEHGVIGYRIPIEGRVLNVLRWSTAEGDARQWLDPAELSDATPFPAGGTAAVSPAEFRNSGFTGVHLAGADYRGYRTVSGLLVEVSACLARGDELIYAYYDGLDRIGHEYGHGAHFDAELAFVDALVGSLIERLPAGACLLLTADHGQVHTGDNTIDIAPSVRALTRSESGEARFRWLHARAGCAGELLDAAVEAHGSDAWVVTADQVVAEGWLGARVDGRARDRLGDVALVAKGTAAFIDPAVGPGILIGRHGSLTEDEMRVPLIVGAAR